MSSQSLEKAWISLCLGVTIALASIQPVWAQENENNSTTGRAAEYLREYLGDRGRAGSMAGSILGGALTAHPAGPILGGLIGFFVGKQTFFEQTAAREPSQAELLRQTELFGAAPGQVGSISFAPSGGAAVLSPSGLIPGGAGGSVPQPAVAAPLAIAPPGPVAPLPALPTTPGAAPIGGQAASPWPVSPAPSAPMPTAPAHASPAMPTPPALAAPPGPPLSATAIAQLCTQGTPVADPRLRRACLYYSASPR